MASQPATSWVMRAIQMALAWLAYGLFRRSFSREHLAVWTGRRAYASGKLDRDSILLRRNIHRLEKGLIMRPAKEVFGDDYITQTVQSFANCLRYAASDDSELRWAADVLKRYFSTTGGSRRIDAARNAFEALPLPSSIGMDVPYKRSSIQPSGVDIEQFDRLCRQRRSVRWFQQRTVEREKITRAVAVAKQAPSACNRQAFKFLVADDPREAASIAGLAMGTRGFADNLPALAVVIGSLAAFPFERDRHVVYIDGSLAAMQFMLALETMGLGSCPINWPDIEEREAAMARKLSLRPYERIVMLIGFGYPDPDGLIPFSHKRDDLLQWVDPDSHGN